MMLSVSLSCILCAGVGRGNCRGCLAALHCASIMNKARTDVVIVVTCAMLLLIAITGCAGNNAGNQKREQDRLAMRMSDIEKQRDELKAQVEQLRNELAAAQQRNQQTQRALAD